MVVLRVLIWRLIRLRFLFRVKQIAELDRRMEAYRGDLSKVTSWEAIQQRILGKNVRRN